jgi:hypothetical protein
MAIPWRTCFLLQTALQSFEKEKKKKISHHQQQQRFWNQFSNTGIFSPSKAAFGELFFLFSSSQILARSSSPT